MTPSVSSEPSFFIAGGTLPRDASCYVRREADEEVFQALRQGEFCYILTPRQMGKSSIMVRTAERLRESGVLTLLVDLTSLGVNVTPDQWYRGQARRIGRQLQKEEAVETFWREATEQGLGPYQKWEAFLSQVVLPSTTRSIALFIDEIDIVRSLPFSADEYLAGIRQWYNARTETPEAKRLTFCLLGVATPFELIQDPRHTPFNIGRRVELKDFTTAEAIASLLPGFTLSGRYPATAIRLLNRVIYWTGGQPYLTQRLCGKLAEDTHAYLPDDVDRWCAILFLSATDREADDHLLFVRERLLRGGADKAAVLLTYQNVLKQRFAPNVFNTSKAKSLS